MATSAFARVYNHIGNSFGLLEEARPPKPVDLEAIEQRFPGFKENILDFLQVPASLTELSLHIISFLRDTPYYANKIASGSIRWPNTEAKQDTKELMKAVIQFPEVTKEGDTVSLVSDTAVEEETPEEGEGEEIPALDPIEDEEIDIDRYIGDAYKEYVDATNIEDNIRYDD